MLIIIKFKLARTCLYNLGPQGELIFIEGMTQDSNPVIRNQCVLGLNKFGPRSIRTIVQGLSDKSDLVKATVEKVIEKMGFNSIISEFKDKVEKLDSLKIALKDVLEKQFYIKNPIKALFKSLIKHFENVQLQRNSYINY